MLHLKLEPSTNQTLEFGWMIFIVTVGNRMLTNVFIDDQDDTTAIQVKTLGFIATTHQARDQPLNTKASDCRVEPGQVQVSLKSTTMELGAPFVMTTWTLVQPRLCAAFWDWNLVEPCGTIPTPYLQQ